jgi:hypothetical protein
MKKHLIGFKPIDERLCKIIFEGRFRNITAHDPTEEKDDTEKEEFYDLLSKTCHQIPKYDTLIILGDFNAKIGRENYISQVAGKYTIRNETSTNGNLLVQFAEMNNLIVVSTCFDHKIIHKGTWKPSGREGINQINQIDHILVFSRHASFIIDVRTCRGLNCDSDHFSVKAILRERLSDIHKHREERRIKRDLDKLKEPDCIRQYQNALEGSLQINLDQDKEEEDENIDVDVEIEWNRIKQSVIQTTTHIIGEKNKGRNVEWFDTECFEALKKKNEARILMLHHETRSNCEIYNDCRRKANKICRKKKREMKKKTTRYN